VLLPEIDWTSAGRSTRKKLYLIVKRLVDTGRIHWPAFMQAAFKAEASRLGPGFQNNFSTGKVSARNAALIYGFLRENFADATASEFPPLDESERPEIRAWLDALDGAYNEPNETDFDFLRFVPIQQIVDDHGGRDTWAKTPEMTGANTRGVFSDRMYAVQFAPWIVGAATGLYCTEGDWFPHYCGQVIEKTDWMWMGGEAGEGLCKPVAFKPGPASYVLIISSADVALQIVQRSRFPFPLREGDLNRLPQMIVSSRSPWTVIRRSMDVR
jgi:hypothetical protein